MSKRLLATSGAAVLFALTVSALPAAAGQAPEPGSSSSVTLPGPPNYPEYNPQYEVPRFSAQDTGLDTTSVALGALGGIALGGAGLGAAIVITRHRRHPQPT